MHVPVAKGKPCIFNKKTCGFILIKRSMNMMKSEIWSTFGRCRFFRCFGSNLKWKKTLGPRWFRVITKRRPWNLFRFCWVKIYSNLWTNPSTSSNGGASSSKRNAKASLITDHRLSLIDSNIHQLKSPWNFLEPPKKSCGFSEVFLKILSEILLL